MKKRLLALFLLFVILSISTSFASSNIDNSIMYEATLAKALKIKDWLTSGTNRAMLAFTLAANAADDTVLGDADLLFAVMQNNPTFVGKDNGSDNLIVATLTSKNMYFMYYSPTFQQAYVTYFPNDNGVDLGGITLETLVSSACSKYYRVTEDEMTLCIKYMQSQLK